MIRGTLVLSTAIILPQIIGFIPDFFKFKDMKEYTLRKPSKGRNLKATEE